MNILLKNGKIITEDGIFQGDLKIEKEKITSINSNIKSKKNDLIIDLNNKVVMPGIIDAHVHYKMAIDKVYTIDLFETGSKSAICGGVTTVIDYAEPIKELSMVDSLKHRINEANKHIFLDYSIHMTISGEMPFDLKIFKKFKKLGINSLKLYTTYKFILDYNSIKKILIEAKKIGLIVTIHSEDNEIIKKSILNLKKKNKVSIKYYSKSRPVESEIKAVKKLIKICKEENVSVHIVHVSSGYTGKIIEEAKKNNIKITAETCPHYLILNNNVYNQKNGALFLMQPPLRSEKERLLLWKQVANGVFDFITTDHCAYSLHQKFFSKNFYDINGGIPGSETLLPVIWSEGVSKKRIDEIMCMKLLSLNPAKLYGLYPQKGTLKVGSDADIVIIDPNKNVIINKQIIHTAADYSPYEGMKIKGYPCMTIIRGKIAFKDGKFFLTEPKGKFIKIKNKKNIYLNNIKYEGEKKMSKTVVIALGGNAILKPKQKGTLEEQIKNVLDASKNIVKLIKSGYNVVIAHGNGPQVGNILLQNEYSKDKIPSMPLYVCGAESQGQIGYMIQQNIKNELYKEGINKKVVTLLTQVVVDKDDIAFKNPTKPVGAFYSENEAKKLIEKGEKWIEDSGRGWRKVVASPYPKEIVELNEIKCLIKEKTILITVGGGGIPVIKENGLIKGIEAVIDKDLASSLLAKKLNADSLIIATDVSHVAINYGKNNQENLKTIDLKTIEKYLNEGQFGTGSMAPKVKAVMSFVKSGGEGIITSLDSLTEALLGNSGTKIIK